MNTKHVSDRKERKALKPKRAETVARGSMKKKVKKMAKGQTIRKR
jgi:hypothetical protein